MFLSLSLSPSYGMELPESQIPSQAKKNRDQQKVDTLLTTSYISYLRHKSSFSLVKGEGWQTREEGGVDAIRG